MDDDRLIDCDFFRYTLDRTKLMLSPRARLEGEIGGTEPSLTAEERIVINLKRSVLSCINADFYDQILILQRFSRSTRFLRSRTARISKLQQNSVKIC